MDCYNPENYADDGNGSDALTIIFICMLLFSTYLYSVFGDPFD